MAFSITRKIEIDAGHRVPLHKSRCRNIHGHRYVIEATVCSNELVKGGEQDGMVMDFGFIKEEMINCIHNSCDHSLILSVGDPLFGLLLRDDDNKAFHSNLVEYLQDSPFKLVNNSFVGNIYIIPYVPTAENLAKHWFDLLEPAIKHRSYQHASLLSLRVYETPNCWSDYPS
jgi:6-pyruvoyltetrahydropterin/6-carboxytetrahydropterin synthase